MSNQNIRVVVRFRPINKREAEEETHVKVDLKYVEHTRVEISATGMLQQKFNFDHVFQPNTEQENFYNITAKPIIKEVLSGFNGTIFAYGQTGAGKSFSIMGDPTSETNKGVIPRCSHDVFQAIEEGDEGTEYKIKVSYLEIYNEQIQDLFDTTKRNLRVHESPQRGIYVEDLTEMYVGSPDDIYELLEMGTNNRVVSYTAMNAVSSRSHSVFTILVEQKNTEGSTKMGKFNIVDLAGSEKVGKTGAKGQTLEEAKMINKSLSALGNCINALVEKKPHIPFRNSKLTRILQESLGGNSKTTMICAVSPHPFNIEETVSTLKFGARAKTIKNRVKVNAQKSAAELEKIVNALKRELNTVKERNGALEAQVEYLCEKSGVGMEELEKVAGSAGRKISANKSSDDMEEDPGDGDEVVAMEELKQQYENEIQRLQDLVEDSTEGKERAEIELSKMRSQLEEQEREMEQVLEEIETLGGTSKDQRDHDEYEMQMLKNDLEDRTAQVDNLRREMEDLQHKLQLACNGDISAETLVNDIEDPEERGRAYAELERLQRQNTVLHETVSHLRLERENLQNAMQEVKLNLVEAENKLQMKGAEGILKEAEEKEMVRLAQEKQVFMGEVQQQQQHIKKQEADLEALLRELDHAEQGRQDLELVLAEKEEVLKASDQRLLVFKTRQRFRELDGTAADVEEELLKFVEQEYGSLLGEMRDSHLQSEKKLLERITNERNSFNDALTQREEEVKEMELLIEEMEVKLDAIRKEKESTEDQLLQMADEVDQAHASLLKERTELTRMRLAKEKAERAQADAEDARDTAEAQVSEMERKMEEVIVSVERDRGQQISRTNPPNQSPKIATKPPSLPVQSSDALLELEDLRRALGEEKRKNTSLKQRAETQQQRIRKLEGEIAALRAGFVQSRKKADKANRELEETKTRLASIEQALEAAQRSAKIRKNRIFKPVSAKTARQKFLSEKVEFGQHILRRTDFKHNLW